MFWHAKHQRSSQCNRGEVQIKSLTGYGHGGLYGSGRTASLNFADPRGARLAKKDDADAVRPLHTPLASQGATMLLEYRAIRSVCDVRVSCLCVIGGEAPWPVLTGQGGAGSLTPVLYTHCRLLRVHRVLD